VDRRRLHRGVLPDPDRSDGDWVWIDGHYNEDGSYIPGHWRPVADAPDGYVWEPGFFDGQVWVEGYWRPARRDGYHWVAATYDGDGIYDAGYWDPRRRQARLRLGPGLVRREPVDRGVLGHGGRVQEHRSVELPGRRGWNDGWDDKADRSAADEGPPIAIPVDQ
jgi:hypothetical protein